MNFDLLNTSCQNAILISEDYCLDKSFDIIDKNLQKITQDLESSSFDIEKFVILKQRYDKNKNLYNKFITFTRQFSSRLISTQNTYNNYKTIWENSSTPFEIIFPEIIELSEWGTFNKGNGVLLENKTTSKKVVNDLSKWINDKFPEQKYGIYKNINVNVFVYTDIPNKFNFKAKHKELCDTSYNDAFLLKCGGKCVSGPGCNKMATDGLGRPTGGGRCGNLGEFCTNEWIDSKGTYGGVTGTKKAKTTGQTTGYCRGWPPGQEPEKAFSANGRPFSGKMLQINSSLECLFDFYLLGYNQIKYTINKDNIWERI